MHHIPSNTVETDIRVGVESASLNNANLNHAPVVIISIWLIDAWFKTARCVPHWTESYCFGIQISGSL